MANVGKLLKSCPPGYPDSCLPEGRKQVQFDVEFEAADFVNPGSASNIPFPSLANIAEWYSAEYDISLGSVQNVNLTAVQGMIVSWVPEDITQILIIDTGDGAPFIIGASVAGANSPFPCFVHARIPLYCPPDQLVRVFLVQQTDPSTMGNIFGDIDITFVNYQIPPMFCISTNAVNVG